ncbi:tripartite motif-containing protein 15 [Ailuropoda melanoleuca]|uniref:tripartite motif-containing protein 15 n=1 Tax=Ailuropoda melanoleuca TaxID=9646 RepID=UPI00149432B4|nr:tripartite motif-containing protein 15 [Ailuropoda melanoleuca]
MPSMPSQEENPCPGCMGPLKDAVTGTCGHIFSQSRLLPPSQMGAQPSCQVLLCVLCKEKEPTKPLVVPVPLGPLGETCCEEHGEKVYFFCKTDAEFLCVACREGPSHRTHTVGVLDGAAQPYWDHFRSQMEARSLEKKQMEGTRRRENEKLQELLTHMDGKKQQVDEAFRRLRQELADHQCLLQARLRKLEQQIRVEGEAYTSTLSEEIAGLGAQVQALGEQLQRPVSALLQDVRANPSRYETKTFVTPETISPDLVKKIRDLHGKILPLPEMLRTFSETWRITWTQTQGPCRWTLGPPAGARASPTTGSRRGSPRTSRTCRTAPCAPRGSRRRGAPPAALRGAIPGPEPAGRRWAWRARRRAARGRGPSSDPGVRAWRASHLRLRARTCRTPPRRGAGPRLRRLLPGRPPCLAVWETGSSLTERRRGASKRRCGGSPPSWAPETQGLLPHEGNAGEPAGF